MANVNTLLNERLASTSKPSKVGDLAKRTAQGNLSGISGLFGSMELSQSESEVLSAIISEYAQEGSNRQHDLTMLITLTKEVKAINNQAALLHGERIKRAHDLLIHYKEGAFTAWLIAAYGNRQTPYNLLQFYEFYNAIPKKLQPQVDLMPRQAIYTLASRQAELSEKIDFVERYDGETKHELLTQIRQRFPTASHDRRRQDLAETAITSLERLSATLRNNRLIFTKAQKKSLLSLLKGLEECVKLCSCD